MTTPNADPDVISRSERTTRVYRSRPVDLVQETTTRKGMSGVVDAHALVTTLGNAIPFASKDTDVLRCLRVEIADGVLTVVSSDRFVMTKQSIPLVTRPAEADDGDARPVREGRGVLYIRDAKYLIRMLRPAANREYPVDVAVNVTEQETTDRWPDSEPATGTDSGEPARIYTFSVEIVRGLPPTRVELPSWGPLRVPSPETCFDAHRPADTAAVVLDPQLMAKFARVIVGSSWDARPAATMTITMAEPGTPLHVTIGDTFEAVFQPKKAAAGQD